MLGREPTTRIVTKEELQSRIASADVMIDDLEIIKSSIPHGSISSHSLVWLRAIIANQKHALLANKRIAEMVLAQFNNKSIEIAKIEIPLNTITVDGEPI